MNAEDLALLVAVGVGAFLLGRHLTLKQIAAQQATAAAADPVDATTAWFMQFGGMR